jgi:hypothetical protein
MSQMSLQGLATGVPAGMPLSLAALGCAVQDASERGGDLARMEWPGEQLTDAGGECLLGHKRAAIPAHKHDRQFGPLAA